MKTVFQNVLSIVTFLLVWELVSHSGLVPQALFPPPTTVARALGQWAMSGELARDVFTSLWRAIVGLFLGASIGMVVGVTTGRVALLRNITVPIVNLFRPIPPVAIIPLTIVWFGIGDSAKVLSIAFASFFPMFTAVYQGASNIPDSYLWAAQSAGLSRIAILIKIVFPATLNMSVAGLRVAIGVAFVMVFVSELAGSSAGLGYQISIMHLNYRIDRMMAAISVLAACAAFTDVALVRTILFACPWIGKVRNR